MADGDQTSHPGVLANPSSRFPRSLHEIRGTLGIWGRDGRRWISHACLMVPAQLSFEGVG